MINATEAANAAMAYLKSFYTEAKNITLEEVELNEEKKSWSVTVSFETLPENEKPLKIVTKVYKIFRIDNTMGQVTSMKSRDFK